MADGIEIERKFLVEQLPHDLDCVSPPGDRTGVPGDHRRRRGAGRRYGDEAFLTIKSSGGESRVEEEIEIDRRRFAALWPLTDGRRIEKRRYRIPAGNGLTLELDVYHGRLEGLLTAEVEFGSVADAAAFVPPDWLGRDVTDDRRYKNQRLATQGLPD